MDQVATWYPSSMDAARAGRTHITSPGMQDQ